MTSQNSPAVRRGVYDMFVRSISQREKSERAQEATRLPREKPMENLDETDFDEKARQAYTNATNLELPPFNPKLFSQARQWARKARSQSGNGQVEVGSISTVDISGEVCLLLIAPFDSNPLACCEIGLFEGMPVHVVSDSCPLAQALLGTPVTDSWRQEVEAVEGKTKTRRVFEGKVLAVC